MSDDDMKLPPGKTCADCFHLKRCVAIFGGDPVNERCGWSPSKFIERKQQPAPLPDQVTIEDVTSELFYNSALANNAVHSGITKTEFIRILLREVERLQADAIQFRQNQAVVPTLIPRKK
jgi:hypothetical protein